MNELLNYIGYEPKEGEEPKFEDVKSYIDSKFIARDRVGEDKELLKPYLDKAYGGYAKRVESKFISLLKENGLDATHSDFQGYQNSEELLEKGIKAFKEKVVSGDAKVDEKLQRQLEDLKSERDRLKTEYESTVGEFTSFKDQVETEKRTNKIEGALKSAMSQVKWGKDIPDVAKRGLKSIFQERYKLEVTEDGKIEPRDKEGNRVYNPNRATEPLTLESLVELEAKKEGLWEKSPHDGKEAPDSKERKRSEYREDEPPKPTRKMNPNFGMGSRIKRV